MLQATAFCHKQSNMRIWVLPYVHNRLVFAEAAVKTLQKMVFDTLLLDLPGFMNYGSWLNAPLAAFPLVSSLLVKEDEETHSIFPLVPTDAACAAAWLAKKRTLAFECVDPKILLDSSCHDLPMIPSLGDERLISIVGLKPYFERAWHLLDNQCKDSPNPSIGNLLFRGKAVASRIHDRILSSRKVLFVCEYRLWWAVRKALDVEAIGRRESTGNNTLLPTRSCALLLEDPYFMWAAGLFDDYPTINNKFQARIQSESTVSFNKHKILAELIGSISKKSDRLNISADVKETLLSFSRKLREGPNSGESRELSPKLLFEKIQSRLEPKAEDGIAGTLLDYPMPTVKDAAKNPPQYFEITEDRIISSTEKFDLPDVFHANPYGEIIPSQNETDMQLHQSHSSGFVPWLYKVHPVMTRQEVKELDEEIDFGPRWAVKRDYELHSYACRVIRQAVLREGAVDLRDEEFGMFTPISFIFCNSTEKPGKLTVISDNNLTRRQIDLGNFDRANRNEMPPPDSVYSLFATMRARYVLFERHIKREMITSLTLLYSGAEMGLDRYAAIMQRPNGFQCRKRPQEDSDLESFTPADLGLAWAIKYAKKQAIAVAFNGWEPSPDIQQFARKQRKQIFALSLDELPEGMTGRLQQLHFISTALKRHPERERILSRFVG